MDDDQIYDEIAKLQRLTLGQLQRRYYEVYGEGSNNRHKHHLIRRIAWRLQVLQKGDLSERARQRALEIARDADLRVQVPSGWIDEQRKERTDRPRPARLPIVGTELRRMFGGREIVAKVLGEGFEYEGKHFTSLSAVARAATGTRWNGWVFFGIKQRPGGKHGRR